MMLLRATALWAPVVPRCSSRSTEDDGAGLNGSRGLFAALTRPFCLSGVRVIVCPSDFLATPDVLSTLPTAGHGGEALRVPTGTHKLSVDLRSERSDSCDAWQARQSRSQLRDCIDSISHESWAGKYHQSGLRIMMVILLFRLRQGYRARDMEVSHVSDMVDYIPRLLPPSDTADINTYTVSTRSTKIWLWVLESELLALSVALLKLYRRITAIYSQGIATLVRHASLVDTSTSHKSQLEDECAGDD